MHAEPPIALIVRDVLGVPSEQWIPRQVAGFTRLRARYAGASHDDSDAGWNARDFITLPYSTIYEAPAVAARWRNRALAALADGSFYARRGADLRSLTRTIARAEPSVILAHFGFTGFHLLPAARRLGIPIVVHFHGYDVWTMSLRNPWYARSARRALGNFDAVVVVGSHQEQWALEQGVPRERLHRIPCGVPTADFQPRATPREPGPLRLLGVGRLHGAKGIDVTLHAMAAAAERSPLAAEATLTLIGDGPLRGDLEALARELAVADRVTFAGAQPIERVREELLRADVFVQHSLKQPDGSNEGFGVAVAEASACGLPVLVSDCGGLPDQVVDNETGLITPQRDADAMADAIARLAQDPALRDRLGVAGRQRMIDRFDAADQARKLEVVLLDCIARRGR